MTRSADAVAARGKHRISGMGYFAVFLFIVLCAYVQCSITFVPPKEMRNTLRRISVLRERIAKYIEKEQRIPGGFSQLPLLDGVDNATTDAWGAELTYSYASGYITIRSLDADRAVGGWGQASDIERSFRSPPIGEVVAK